MKRTFIVNNRRRKPFY